VDSQGISSVERVNATEIDARNYQNKIMISTDPPYYDNVGYADLSDFYYVWLRQMLANYYPELFSTMLTPKSEELIATPFRHEGKYTDAKEFFEEKLEMVFSNFTEIQTHNYPITIYYAFKQAESSNSTQDISKKFIEVVSTGWETILNALINRGFEITGTWPIRTERSARPVASGTNALASSIILVCRQRTEDSTVISRREYINLLSKELPRSIMYLKQSSIAPVDLAQAAIGPGMAVFSKYKKVLEADGSSMSVRSALAVINQVMDEYLAEQEGDIDADTRWAVAWYEQFGVDNGSYGIAETLSKAKNTSIQGLVQSGILESRAGKVRLLKREELDISWTPEKDKRLTTWVITQYIILALENEGEHAAAELMAKLGAEAESARDLAYRLYTICERKGWAQDALGYNMLVVAWPHLKEMASKATPQQESFL